MVPLTALPLVQQVRKDAKTSAGLLDLDAFLRIDSDTR